MSGYIGITKPVHVLSGVTLTFSHADVNLDYDGQLIVDAGGSLILDDNETITAWATYGQRQIIINGYLEIGDNLYTITPNALADESRLNIIINNRSLNLTFNHSDLRFTILETHNNSNTFNNCGFRECDLLGYNGNFYFTQCEFQNLHHLHLTNQSLTQRTAQIMQSGIEFNYTSDVSIDNYATVRIQDNLFAQMDEGVSLFNCGARSAVIDNNIFWEINYGTGLQIYNTKAVISNNTFNNMEYGLKCLNHSSIRLYGECEEITQEFDECTNSSISGSYESFPYYFKYNFVKKDPWTTYLLNFNLLIDIHLDAKDNKWNTVNPTPYFIPSQNYYWEPVWIPGNCGYKSGDIAENMFNTAREHIEIENYLEAKDLLKQIINEYPSSPYAKASLREIFDVEPYCQNNYDSLKIYYQTNQVIQSDLVLEKTAEYLANYCDIHLENWQNAIDWFESVILNPDSDEDSIFAIIDLGNLYNLMENNGYKNLALGNLLQYKPASEKQFTENRDYLLSLIPENNTTIYNKLKKTRNGELLQNIPNPFNGSTQIWYKLEADATVQLNVYNNFGQLVRSMNEGMKQKGNRSINFYATGLKNGIYFYSISINGQTTDSKKMTIMK